MSEPGREARRLSLARHQAVLERERTRIGEIKDSSRSSLDRHEAAVLRQQARIQQLERELEAPLTAHNVPTPSLVPGSSGAAAPGAADGGPPHAPSREKAMRRKTVLPSQSRPANAVRVARPPVSAPSASTSVPTSGGSSTAASSGESDNHRPAARRPTIKPQGPRPLTARPHVSRPQSAEALNHSPPNRRPTVLPSHPRPATAHRLASPPFGSPGATGAHPPSSKQAGGGICHPGDASHAIRAGGPNARPPPGRRRSTSSQGGSKTMVCAAGANVAIRESKTTNVADAYQRPVLSDSQAPSRPPELARDPTDDSGDGDETRRSSLLPPPPMAPPPPPLSEGGSLTNRSSRAPSFIPPPMENPVSSSRMGSMNGPPPPPPMPGDTSRTRAMTNESFDHDIYARVGSESPLFSHVNNPHIVETPASTQGGLGTPQNCQPRSL